MVLINIAVVQAVRFTVQLCFYRPIGFRAKLVIEICPHGPFFQIIFGAQKVKAPINADWVLNAN